MHLSANLAQQLASVNTRVVRRAELESLIDTQALRAQVEAERQALTQTVEAAREQARAEGHAAGYAAGQEAWAQELLARHAQHGQQLQALQQSLSALVMRALRELLHSLPADMCWEGLAKQALQTVVQARRVRLVVACGDLARAQALMSAWAGSRELQWDVVADPSLAPGDCVLETELGAVEGRLEPRLRSMEAALHNSLAAALATNQDGAAG